MKTYSNEQMTFDAHNMSKVDFVEFYQIALTVDDAIPSVKQLSTMWHSMKRKDCPQGNYRRSVLSDLNSSWTKPGSAAAPKHIEGEAVRINVLPITEEVIRAAQNGEVQKAAIIETADNTDTSFESMSRIDQVKYLIGQGITSNKELAERLGTHPGYISTLRKKLQ